MGFLKQLEGVAECLTWSKHRGCRKNGGQRLDGSEKHLQTSQSYVPKTHMRATSPPSILPQNSINTQVTPKHKNVKHPRKLVHVHTNAHIYTHTHIHTWLSLKRRVLRHSPDGGSQK